MFCPYWDAPDYYQITGRPSEYDIIQRLIATGDSHQAHIRAHSIVVFKNAMYLHGHQLTLLAEKLRLTGWIPPSPVLREAPQGASYQCS